MEVKISPEDKVLVLGFIEEAMESLDGIEEKILEMEASYSDDLVNNIFRAVHTIKGTSSFLNLLSISSLSHELEFLLDDIRKGKREISQDIIDVLLKGTDILRSIVENVKEQINQQGKKKNITVELENTDKIIEEIKEVREGEINPPPSKLPIEEEKKPREEEKPNINSLPNAEISNDIVSQYNEELEEHIQNIENRLLTLEENMNDLESLREIFRSLHSIKGNSALVISLTKKDTYESELLKIIQDVSHKAESVLEPIKMGEKQLSAQLVQAIFKILDYIKLLFVKFKNREKREKITPPGEILDYLQAIINDKVDKQNINKGEKSESKDNELDIIIDVLSQYLEVSEKILNLWEKEKNLTEKNIKTYTRVINLLKKTIPDELFKKISENIQKQEDTLVLLEKGKFILKDGIALGILKDSFNEIKKLKEDLVSGDVEFKVEKVGEILLKKGKIKESDLAEALKEQEKQKSIGNKLSSANKLQSKTYENIQSIRVKMEKLDKLMNLIGELVISKNSFFHIYKKLVEYGANDIAKEFKESMMMKIGRLSDELQNTIVQIRMIPIKTVFQKFPRMVRDLAIKNGKKIKLVLEGEETELDKTVIEQINDPLVHIIRNSCDHGIESPEERINKKKDETGTIILKAEKKGNNVFIMIIDDGKGIDIERVKNKAIERGIVSEKEIEKMSKKEIINLIFMPGFSTAEKVTDVSGRGVGMDVVKTNILKLKGSIDIETEKGVGTTIIIKLPLTLAITKGLSFKLEKDYFIVPLETVDEIVKIEKEKIIYFKDRKIVNIRGEIIELLDLKEIYNLKTEEEIEDDDEKNIIIINDSGIKFGLIVDSLEDEIDMVVKPLPEYLSMLPGVGGSTILGDGTVALVINPIELIDLLN